MGTNMARIRSVHPGLWTDERFASVSMAARLLFIGIWNECDDQGSFEWSPIKLKMRILPADSVDARELLAELEEVGSLLAYEIDGRKFGAVRNFTQYQRPKKPNSVYPQTDEVRNFVGLKVGEVPNQFPTGGEKAPQMEEEGGRRKEEKEKEGDAADAATHLAFSGRTIRLNDIDLARWRKTYHAIADVEAELVSLDGWWEGQTAEKKKRWFHTTQGALNRKHQELLQAAKVQTVGEFEMPIA
jgi:hypothetical protein